MNFMKQLLEKMIPQNCRPLLRKIRSCLYLGKNVYCPCCGGGFRKFIPFKAKYIRLNAMCPLCNSLERHRLLWLYFSEKTNIFHDELRVLHFAPEYIYQKKLSSLSNLKYISADLNSERALVKMDITNVTYKDNSFDVILCNHVLEHVVEDRKAMIELFRVLKPGGWAIIDSPVDYTLDKTYEDHTVVAPGDRERLFGRYDHVRIYGRDYKNRLEEAGFKVDVDRDFVEKLGDKFKMYGLKGKEEIFLCTKDVHRGI